jgi:hypothetical protein
VLQVWILICLHYSLYISRRLVRFRIRGGCRFSPLILHDVWSVCVLFYLSLGDLEGVLMILSYLTLSLYSLTID